MSTAMGAEKNLRGFMCHKYVHADKIVAITPVAADLGGGAVLDLEGGDKPRVTETWQVRHTPAVGGYYVRYEDGYSSYSPAGAFETGYTALGSTPPEGLRLAQPVLRFFAYTHLRAGLPREVSALYARLAYLLAGVLPSAEMAEITKALDALLVSKDCAVRAALELPL